MRMRPLSGLFDRRARRLRMPVSNVGGHGIVEENRFLGHHPNLLTQRLKREAPDVGAVDQQSSPGDIIKTRDQIDQCRFARPDPPTMATRSPAATPKAMSRNTGWAS